MVNKISAVKSVYTSGNGSDAHEQYLAWAKEMDQKQTEAVRYHKEVGKTPEDLRRERKLMRSRGIEAFQMVLEEKINQQKRA